MYIIKYDKTCKISIDKGSGFKFELFPIYNEEKVKTIQKDTTDTIIKGMWFIFYYRWVDYMNQFDCGKNWSCFNLVVFRKKWNNIDFWEKPAV